MLGWRGERRGGLVGREKGGVGVDEVGRSLGGRD